jgi:hypothetical protein
MSDGITPMIKTLLLPQGMYRDQITTAAGKQKDQGWQTNRIVDRCRYLIAAFMRGDGPLGIQQLQIGQGLASWDDDPPSIPPPTAQQLTDPAPFVVNLSPTQIEYLDTAGNSTAAPTNRLQITITLAANEPPLGGDETSYPLREFGLFGNFGGEAYMINYVRHPVIHKQAGDTVTRTIRLVF